MAYSQITLQVTVPLRLQKLSNDKPVHRLDGDNLVTGDNVSSLKPMCQTNQRSVNKKKYNLSNDEAVQYLYEKPLCKDKKNLPNMIHKYYD